MVTGLAKLYKYSLNSSHLKTISGTIIRKDLEKVRSTRSTAYYLVYTLKEYNHKIGFEFYPNSHASNLLDFDSTKIDNYYKFYLNPAVSTQKDQYFGIRRIDYNNKPVFILEVKPFIGRSILSIILALVLSIFMYSYYKEEKIKVVHEKRE